MEKGAGGGLRRCSGARLQFPTSPGLPPPFLPPSSAAEARVGCLSSLSDANAMQRSLGWGGGGRGTSNDHQIANASLLPRTTRPRPHAFSCSGGGEAGRGAEEREGLLHFWGRYCQSPPKSTAPPLPTSNTHASKTLQIVGSGWIGGAPKPYNPAQRVLLSSPQQHLSFICRMKASSAGISIHWQIHPKAGVSFTYSIYGCHKINPPSRIFFFLFRAAF